MHRLRGVGAVSDADHARAELAAAREEATQLRDELRDATRARERADAAAADAIARLVAVEAQLKEAVVPAQSEGCGRTSSARELRRPSGPSMVTVAEGDEQAGAPLAPMAVPSPKRPLGEVNCAQPGNANAQPGEKRSRLSNSSNPPAGRVEVEVHALEKPAAATAAQQANGAKQPGGFKRLMGMGGAKSKRDDDFVAVAPADGGGAPPTKAPEPTPVARRTRAAAAARIR